MGEKETLRMIRSLYGSILISAASQYRHRPEVLAGIMMRETAGGTSHLLDCIGPAGRGDGGHGHGLMQIDDRSFPEFCAGENWKDPGKNIHFGALVLRNKRAYLSARLLGYQITDEELERAVVAAYNAGEGRVLKTVLEGRDPDAVTAHSNYSREVLRLAEVYRTMGVLE